MCKQIGRWCYTGFYGFSERRHRQESCELIQNLKSRSVLPWCILGDFNNMLFGFKKVGGRPHPRSLLEGFNKVITDCNLIEPGFIGSEFTWEKSRDGFKRD